jgi:pimeloyl-ACP methyl ester carboxylesterase
VLTYDRRGHSQSERPASQGSVHEDVADLAALIEELDLAPAHIVGNSFGGSIVLRLAGERPDLFRSLIVQEPPLFSLLTNEPDGQAMLQTLKARIDAVDELLEAGAVSIRLTPASSAA